MGLVLQASAAGVPKVLPDPDGKPANMTKPVKVYILAGQSNMVGFGRLSGAKNPHASIFAMTVAARSFLRYNHAQIKEDYPPNGHLGAWLEEQKLTPEILAAGKKEK